MLQVHVHAPLHVFPVPLGLLCAHFAFVESLTHAPKIENISYVYTCTTCAYCIVSDITIPV